jgi:hypothetical protein
MPDWLMTCLSGVQLAAGQTTTVTRMLAGVGV